MKRAKPARPFAVAVAVTLTLAVLLGSLLASAVGCGPAASGSRYAEAMNEPIAATWRARCGGCHRRVEPHSRDATVAKEALARHRSRVRLTDDQWSALERFVARPFPEPTAPDAPATTPPAPPVDAAAPAPQASTAGVAGDEDAAGEESDEVLPPAAATSSSLLAEVDRQLSAMKSTSYSHRVSVDESAARFDYDCSGFVGYALQRVRANSLEPIPHPGKRRPLAEHFQEFFGSLGDGDGIAVPGGGRWSRVVRVADIAPGDVIAWKKPASSRSKNTGHVLVAHGPARRDTRNGDTLLVDIVDSTAIPHGDGDARRAHATTGLGTGTIGLVVDGAGQARAYRWSAGGPTKETAIAVGRLR